VTMTVTESPPTWAPEYLDMGGVAHLLSTSQKQVQRMLASGRLPKADLNISGVGGPRGRRWRRDVLLQWLKSQEP
jgi:predicted DNA-binding transcriptional regulator AlpA